MSNWRSASNLGALKSCFGACPPKCGQLDNTRGHPLISSRARVPSPRPRRHVTPSTPSLAVLTAWNSYHQTNPVTHATYLHQCCTPHFVAVATDAIQPSESLTKTDRRELSKPSPSSWTHHETLPQSWTALPTRWCLHIQRQPSPPRQRWSHLLCVQLKAVACSLNIVFPLHQH